METQTTGETPTTDRKADILQEIKNILRDNCEIEIDLDDLDGINDTNDLYNEHVERAIQEQTGIIYYSRAIEYLSENDPSLTESLAVASEMGYSLDDLDSEKLASLLNYKLTLDTFWTFSSDLDALIEERHEIEGDEETIDEKIENLEETIDERIENEEGIRKAMLNNSSKCKNLEKNLDEIIEKLDKASEILKN